MASIPNARAARAILPDDYPRRLRYAQWFNQSCQTPKHFLQSIIIQDEARFSMNGEVITPTMCARIHRRHFQRHNSRERLTICAER